ncbi:hypothetical protein [Polaromonas sp.]|jgi:hypothetical protein|uniref:hypothetical protein n=1 Tax=Polaromonas sp. TaxID=1869339 RepID=UPI001D248026|nr:hypothetical protein [Polaromonas sp.]MBT9475550.1 hypothetical protein [Polaromonas sp.]
MKFLGFFGPACTALSITLSTQVVAQNSAIEPLIPTTALHSAGHAGFDKPVSAAMLGDYRGGSGLVYNDMKLAGTTAGNTAIDVATGTNTISAGAFSNMSGLPLVVQNSGANVLIQNAVILNLQMN